MRAPHPAMRYCLAVSMLCTVAQGVEISLVPVRASGSHEIVGNEIFLDGAGQQVVIDIFVSDWDPTEAGLWLSSFQAVIEPVGYSSGLGGTLTPFIVPCTTSAQCAAHIGGGGTCGANGFTGLCPAGFFDVSREDFLFRGIAALSVVDIVSIRYRYASVATQGFALNMKCVGGILPGNVCQTDAECPGFGEIIPPGTCEINHDDRYAGTLMLDVPVGAKGTFTLDLALPPDSQMLDDLGGPYEPQTLISARITIRCQFPADCDDGSLCTDDVCLGDGTCSNTPNYPASRCCDPDTGDTVLISDGIQCTQDVCDPETGDVSHPPELAGTNCGSAASSECDNRDVCDGAGACSPNYVPADTPCGDFTDTVCNPADTCDGSGACSDNLAPGGTACGDTNSTDCTAPDTCNGNGTCLDNHAPNGAACNDGLFCNENEICTSGQCGGGATVTCNDGISCTTDTCNEGADRCDNLLNAGWCLILGVCHANGGLNPANDCEACDTITSTGAWTPLSAGSACGNPTDTQCNGRDTCDGAGACQDNFTAPSTPCGDFSVTQCDLADTCSGTGNCDSNFVAPGTTCGDASDTDCTDPDTCNATGVCLRNDEPNGTSCDDGLFCNENEACTTGACGGGNAINCDDSIPCTTDTCDENLNRCDHSLDPAQCLIAGTCYADGDFNPANDCQECDWTADAVDWSFRADGSICDDGIACTGTGSSGIGDDTCDGAGVCSGLPDPACDDDCNFAVPVTEGVTLGNNDNHGPDDAEASCQPNSNNDVWFVYTASCIGEVFITTEGSQFAPSNDPVLSVYTSCADTAGTEIECDDNSGAGLQASLSISGTPGATYYIRVAGVGTNTGNIVLTISRVDDCIIDSVCYATGTINGGNDCQACLPALSTSAWSPRPAGSLCGDDTATECNNPDVCNEAGLCVPNFEPDGVSCGDEGNDCTFDECASGACTHPYKPVGRPCGDGSDSECDHPDSCNGTGGCLVNFEDVDVPCGDDSATECDWADICNGSGLCDDNLAPDATECDDTDVCTGGDQCAAGLCVGAPIPQAPIVVGEGSKHLYVTPQPPGAPAPVALHLTSPTWACVSAYITADGQLSSEPVFQTPAEWGTILVGGGLVEISPLSEYEVVAECGGYASAAGSSSTVEYGDVAGPKEDGQWTPPEGSIDVIDWLAVIAGFVHDPTAPAYTRIDLFPCEKGDNDIEIRDILASIFAFLHTPYPCERPCP